MADNESRTHVFKEDLPFDLFLPPPVENAELSTLCVKHHSLLGCIYLKKVENLHESAGIVTGMLALALAIASDSGSRWLECSSRSGLQVQALSFIC